MNLAAVIDQKPPSPIASLNDSIPKFIALALGLEELRKRIAGCLAAEVLTA